MAGKIGDSQLPEKAGRGCASVQRPARSVSACSSGDRQTAEGTDSCEDRQLRGQTGVGTDRQLWGQTESCGDRQLRGQTGMGTDSCEY